MPRKNTPDARNRILQTAVKIFAEKSFEGSRIDEIAREAGVPKSLIYYHFKSKDDILEVLTQNFIDEYMSLIRAAEQDTHEKKAQELSQRIQNQYAAFGQRNADLIRVMFIDSLKKSKEEPILFKVVEEMVAAESKFPHFQASAKYNVQERRVAEFFTSMIPLYSYICFAESWTKYFGIEKEVFGKLFMDIVIKAHADYHKTHD